MKKNLFRLLTVFVYVFAAWSPLTVQAQPPASEPVCRE